MIQEARPLIEWPEVVVEYVGFVAQFVATGAVGFRYAAVRDRLRATLNVGATGDGRFYAYACARAARIGLLGAIVSAIFFAQRLPDLAARAHTTVSDLVMHDHIAGAQTLLTVVGVLGLLIAAARVSWGWPLAAIGIILGPLSGILSGQWMRLVNPGAPRRRGAVDRHAVRARRRRPGATATRHDVARPSRHYRGRHGERLLAARAHLRRRSSCSRD